jgi:hypothetical protein
VADGPESALPEPPRLPQRAAIYIAPDGSVKFGALFEDLLPVALAVSNRPLPPATTTDAAGESDVER